MPNFLAMDLTVSSALTVYLRTISRTGGRLLRPRWGRPVDWQAAGSRAL